MPKKLRSVIIEGNIVKIQLSRGYFAIVDIKDKDIVDKCNWSLKDANTRHLYATGKLGLLHRVLMKAPKSLFVDHINGDGLDNRRCNLRIVTRRQNNLNARKHKGFSKYKGVTKHRNGKWKAAIRIKRVFHHLGIFICEKAAALAYNKMALKHYGAYASLNDV